MAKIDTRGVPSHECLNCGSVHFQILAQFEDYAISWYSLNGVCHECKAPLTVPCPSDDPTQLEFILKEDDDVDL